MKTIAISNNPIFSEIDLAAMGKNAGYLRLPHSVHRSAYGWIPVPVASIKNGDGPVVLVMAGNHGDEYEGQIIVSRLIREIQPEMIVGQLILLPMANFPAAEAGTRTSPIDGGNLNRAFPGKPRGTPTEVIADYIENSLLPRVTYLVDLHSGGSSLMYDGGYALAQDPGNEAARTHVKSILTSFNLPKAYLHEHSPVNSAAAAERGGATAFLLELGGGGLLNSELVEEGRAGVLRFLNHIGLLNGELVPAATKRRTEFLVTETPEHFLYTHVDGVFEGLAKPGDEVERGQPAARIHFPNTPLREPLTLHFACQGFVACMRTFAAVRRGDCLYQLASRA